MSYKNTVQPPSSSVPALRTVAATRYVTPLREGGSLPAIIEANDLGTYVLKFRGAGQGAKVLVAELIAGEIARALGLPMPEIVLVHLDPILGRSEPDPEIQSLIQASAGLNLALDYLPGSMTYDPLISPPPDSNLASAIVWFDGYVSNVDRTARNTNMLVWHRTLYLIDNGASLYFQYAGDRWDDRADSPFAQIRDHVLLPWASDIRAADDRLAATLTPATLEAIVGQVPETWLDGTVAEKRERRAAFVDYLVRRVQGPRIFAREAIDARNRLV